MEPAYFFVTFQIVVFIPLYWSTFIHIFLIFCIVLVAFITAFITCIKCFTGVSLFIYVYDMYDVAMIYAAGVPNKYLYLYLYLYWRPSPQLMER